jgi:outer membrane usher protein
MRVLNLLPALMLMTALEPDALAQSLPEAAVSGGGAGSAAKAAVARPVITINLALKDAHFYLGEIPSQISDERVEAIEQETLLKLAAPLLKEAMMQTVKRLPAQAGFVRLKDLKEAGLPFDFDIGQMTLSFFPTADMRPSSHISLSQNGDEASPEQLARKASISGYLNLSGSVQYTEASGPLQPALLAPALGTSAAIRVLDLVIENEATLGGPGHLSRQGTRAVYDDTSNAIRYTAGDITPATEGIQTGGGFLGVSIQKSYGKLQPQKTIRPTGQRSFRLERPSEVAIIVNGQVVRRLQMPPGDHDISELPLRSGENMLTLDITDDTGHRETLKFTVFYDHTLLAPGVSEWGLAAGYHSTMSPSGVVYAWRDPAVTGYYQQGLTEDVTATVHAQSTIASSVAGVMAVTPTRLGRFSAELDGSLTADGLPGVAASLFYTPDTLFKNWGLPGMAQLAGQYKSGGFTPLFAANGSLGELFSLNGFYSVALPDEYTVAVSGALSAGAEYSAPKPGAGVTLSKSIQPDWTWSVTLSYDGSPTVSQSASPGQSPSSGGWSVLGRVAWKPGRDTEVTLTQEGWTGKSTLGVASEGSAADGHYAVKADMVRDLTQGPAQEQADLSASYSGARFDLAASRTRRVFEANGGLSSDVSQLSGATAIAFADEHVAVGRPVADSFAILTPHDPADATTLKVPGEAFPRARSVSLSPALVSDLPSYSRSQFAIEAQDPPEGYDLGTGMFDVRPAYRSGYALTAGSERGVMAIGSLEAEGKPLALISGLAKEESAADPKKVVVFTNRAGRFCAEGLKPGAWRVEMIGEPPLCYRLSIPDSASGLFDAGTLKPGCPK